MIISVLDRVEKMWKKEKMLVTSIFSFSYNVLKKLFSQTRQKVSLCENGSRGVIIHINGPGNRFPFILTIIISATVKI